MTTAPRATLERMPEDWDMAERLPDDRPQGWNWGCLGALAVSLMLWALVAGVIVWLT